MKQIAHLMVGLVFGFLLTALTFDTPSRAAQGVVKTQPVRVADAESDHEWQTWSCDLKIFAQDSSEMTILLD